MLSLLSLHSEHLSATSGRMGFLGVASGPNDIFLAAGLRRAGGGILEGGMSGVAWGGAGTMREELVIGFRGDGV